MKCEEVNYKIIGEDLQFVEVELDPTESVVAEAGAMIFMEEGIQFETKMGDGSKASGGVLGTLMSAGKRLITGESLFMTHFKNEGNKISHVSFGASYPGRVIPLDMKTLPSNEILCQKDAFLCAALGTELSIAFTKKIGAGFFGGEGFILQRLKGDGMAFLHAGGTIVHRKLKGEKLRVDTGSIVAFSKTIDYSIERAGNLKSMFLGGEGLFLATLQGEGDVWLQSLPFSRLADRIAGEISVPSSSSSKGFNPLASFSPFGK